MRELRPRPDLDQLRRQARELLRAAQAAEPTAIARLKDLDAPTTLAGAQLTVAREHGCASWPKLKEEAERRVAEPVAFVLRYARSVEDLRTLWVVVNRILGDPPGPRQAAWGVFDDFDAKRTTMLVVEHEGRTIGGTVQLKLMALEPWARGVGLGRRLVQTVEGELLSLGHGLGAHADPENRGFFLKLGYSDRGQSKQHMAKGTPLSPRLLQRRLDVWRQQVGDLDHGVILEVDPTTGRIPPLPW